MELPNRPALEAKFGKRLQKLSNRHMRELIALMGNPPDMDAVGPEFWRRVQKETEEEAAILLLLLFMSSASAHAKAEGADVRQVQPVLMQQAQNYATRNAATVAVRTAVGASIRFENMKKRVNESTAQVGAPTKAEILAESEPIFSPGQNIKTARDETTRARHQGAEAGVKVTTGTSEEDLWQNRPSMSRTGPCPLCAPLDNAPRSIWSLVYPQGPPSPHIGCVCVIKYASEKILGHL